MYDQNIYLPLIVSYDDEQGNYNLIMSKNLKVEGIENINEQLRLFINALIQKMKNPDYYSQLLNRKTISQLPTKIYKLVSEKGGNTKEAEQNKNILYKMAQSHLTNFIKQLPYNHIIYSFIRLTEEARFAQIFALRWKEYKLIVFSLFSILIHIKDYYQTARLTEMKKVETWQATKQQLHSPLPLPALAVILFENMVLKRFQGRIKKLIVELIKQERRVQDASNKDLQTILEAIWCCSYKELARINISKDSIFFTKQERKMYTSLYKDAAKNEIFFENYTLRQICKNAQEYYLSISEQLQSLSVIEQIEAINNFCDFQHDLASFHLPSKYCSNIYLKSVYRFLILTDFNRLLTKSMGFKHILSQYAHSSSQFQQEIKIYFKAIKLVQEDVIDAVTKVIEQVIAQRGQQIRQKIGKPKQFMQQLLNFKKSLRKIFTFVQTNTFKIEMIIEKGFKLLMDGFQTSRILADFTDSLIKQCIRLRLDQSNSEERMKQIIFMLTSLSAKDLFLAYHQENLSKRLIDSLNQPKLQPEIIFLKMLAQNLGSTLVNAHFGMIKDVQNSLQVTDKISQSIPFISYKWDLRVINQSVWPQSAFKDRFSFIESPIYLKNHLDQLSFLYKKQRGFSLKWKLQRGTSLFQGKFLKGKYRFQAQNIYLIILLHLGQAPSFQMNVSKLVELFKESKKEGENNNHLENYLKALVQAKLIKRQNKNIYQNFKQQQLISINTQFTPTEQVKPNQSIIIRMSPQLAKTVNLANVEVNRVLKDREKLVDALLVKLLKHSHSTGSNSITFAELYEGIKTNIYLVNFNFSQTAVKERIQQLITRGYCIRDLEDRRVYHYIA